MKRNYAPENLIRVLALRNDATRSEKRLWYDGLADSRLGFRFRRQYPLGPYVLDFYCPGAQVCVEVDGESHLARGWDDAVRDAHMSRQGVLTLRFLVGEVVDDLEPVLEKIRAACLSRVSVSEVAPASPETGDPHPALPLQARGGSRR